jgi:hypothetical protein
MAEAWPVVDPVMASEGVGQLGVDPGDRTFPYPLRVRANSHSPVILYKFLTNSNHLLYLESPLLEVLALDR